MENLESLRNTFTKVMVPDEVHTADICETDSKFRRHRRHVIKRRMSVEYFTEQNLIYVSLIYCWVAVPAIVPCAWCERFLLQ
jgi:hypothetical protein